VDHFVIGNHHASTVMVLGEDGGPEASYAYTDSGRITGSDGRPLRHEPLVPYLFQGQEHDWTSGLDNYRARLYDSDTLRFLAPDPAFVPGQPVYVAMNKDTVNFADPDGRMIAGDWQTVLREHRQDLQHRALGWGMTFIVGPIYLGLMSLPELALAPWYIHPVGGVLGGAYVTYLAWHMLRDWRDRTARTQGLVITGTIVAINQAGRSGVDWLDRLVFFAGYDLPSAMIQVSAAQGGPLFASPIIGYATDGKCKRVLVYVAVCATNTFAEFFANGLVIQLQHMFLPLDPTLASNATFIERTAIASANPMVGNTCFYLCMAYYDVKGYYRNNMFKTVACKNVWMVCRVAGRTVKGAYLSQKNDTWDRVSEGLYGAFIGYSVDRVIGSQILANLPLSAVHGLFFQGSAVPNAPTLANGMTWAEWTQVIDQTEGTMLEDFLP
jgi:RHS repeat-associated protein